MPSPYLLFFFFLDFFELEPGAGCLFGLLETVLSSDALVSISPMSFAHDAWTAWLSLSPSFSRRLLTLSSFDNDPPEHGEDKPATNFSNAFNTTRTRLAFLISTSWRAASIDVRKSSLTSSRPLAAALPHSDASVSGLVTNRMDNRRKASDFKKGERASWDALDNGEARVAWAKLQNKMKKRMRKAYSCETTVCATLFLPWRVNDHLIKHTCIKTSGPLR
jgi:hypothetical protein